MQTDFKLYKMDIKYIRNLHNIDNKVLSISPQAGKDNNSKVVTSPLSPNPLPNILQRLLIERMIVLFFLNPGIHHHAVCLQKLRPDLIFLFLRSVVAPAPETAGTLCGWKSVFL